MARINHVALKVADLEAATKFYENVYGFRQVHTGRSRGHISRHLTDGYIDLALMVYDTEEDAEAKLVGPGPAIHHFALRRAPMVQREATGRGHALRTIGQSAEDRAVRTSQTGPRFPHGGSRKHRSK